MKIMSKTKISYRLQRYLTLFQLPAPVLKSLLAGRITFRDVRLLKGSSEIYATRYVLEFLYRLERDNWQEKAKRRFQKECRKLKGVKP
jgi:hypothetical protein